MEKNKKTLGFGMLIIGGILIVVAIAMMVTGGNNDVQLDNNNENDIIDNNNGNNGNNGVNNEEESCEFRPVRGGELVLEFKCESFYVIDKNLTFKLNKNDENGYNLNIDYMNGEIYSSSNNGIVMYTSEMAGNTSIINVDDLYLVYTYTAAQCGNYGHLVIVSKTGELVNSFSGLFNFDYKNNNVYVKEISEEQCSNINGIDGLYDIYNISDSTMIKEGRGYLLEKTDKVTDGDLTFEFTEVEEAYYVNVSFGSNKIFSSLDNKLTIFTDDHAGYTVIDKIDNVYLLNTAAAGQCGDKGSLIVINGKGNVLGVYESLNYKLDRANKTFTFVEDQENKCNDITGSPLINHSYSVKGDNIIKK